MTIQEFIKPITRWWWLLLVATLLSAGTSYYVVNQQPPIYRSVATLIIGRSIDDPNPNSSELYLAQQLAATYANIANREPLQEATKKALEINWLPEYNARALPNSNLIEITVTDTNPQRAQVIANELANQLVLRSPTSARPEEQERQDFIANQLNLLESQINETQEQISEIQNRLGGLVSAREIAEAQTQLNALDTKLSSLQSNYASLLSNTESGAVNTLAIFEPANFPARPIGPDILMTVLLSAAISLSLAGGAAYLLEFLDKTVKSIEEIDRLAKAPRLGSIPEISNGSAPWTHVNEHPRSEVADAFRTLRTNLDFIQLGNSVQTLLVTSPTVGDGKSTTAINLALIMAHAEKRVVLVDTDLRRPVVHKALKIRNDVGFTDLFLNPGLYNQVIQSWGRPSISVLPSGKLPPNPTDLLGSNRASEILAYLRTHFDIIIIDGPPLIIADAAVVAAKVDGVLAVIRPGYTQKDKIAAMREQLKLSGANLIGVVVNGMKHSGAQYYRYYQPHELQEPNRMEKLFSPLQQYRKRRNKVTPPD